MKLSKKKSMSSKWWKLSPKKIKLVAYAIFATLTILLFIAWLVRDRIWNMNEFLRQEEELAQVKAILRVQSDLLQEAVKDMSGLRDVMLLETAQARAFGARAMLSTDRDRAVLDEIIVSLQKDAEEIAKDETVPEIAKREKIKEAAWRLRADLVGLFGPEFFKGKVEIVRVKSRLDDETGMRDEVGNDGASNPWSASSSSSSSASNAASTSDDSGGDQDLIENDNVDDENDEEDFASKKSSTGAATQTTTKKLRSSASSSTSSFGSTSKKKKSSKSGKKSR